MINQNCIPCGKNHSPDNYPFCDADKDRLLQVDQYSIHQITITLLDALLIQITYPLTER